MTGTPETDQQHDPILKTFDVFKEYPRDNVVAMDRAHVAFIISTVTAHKPLRVLELGIGSGFLSRALLAALRFNEKGTLCCVDNFADWSGQRPTHCGELEVLGAKIVQSDEEAFLRSCDNNAYDLIVSDGDHSHAYFFSDQLFRVCAPEGMVFFHDTNNPTFPNLGRLLRRVARCGLPYMHFAAESRKDERTSRGLLLAINRGRYRVDLYSRLWWAARKFKHHSASTNLAR